jgi:histidinol-phosphatase
MGRMVDDLALAQHAAMLGGRLALRHFETVSQLPRELKADGSIVTLADRAVEEAVRGTLLEQRPGDGFLGEESGASGQGPRRWILDPIDGTAMFVAGDDRWLTLLALERDGQVVLGVAAVPAQGRLWWAARGAGAYVADIEGDALVRRRRIAVSAPAPTLPESRFGVVPDVAAHTPSDHAVIARLSAVCPPRPWATHAGLLVAAGELDLAVQVRGQVWDFAATSLIVEEAGGRFSSATGGTHPVTGPAVYSAGGALHAAALERLA